MLRSLKDKLVRFLSIVGGFSSPEDIARAKRRGSSEEADRSKKAGGPSSNPGGRDEKGNVRSVK